MDVVYLDMEDDNTSIKQSAAPAVAAGQVGKCKNIEMKSWIVTPTVRYHVLEQGQFRLDLLAGARYFYLDVELEVDIDGIKGHERAASGSDSDYVWDGIVGVRGEVTLNEKWYLPYYLDFGTGNSEVTYQAFGGVGYRFSRVDLVAGYRYLRWDFDDSPVFDSMYITGPMAGVKIRF